MDEKNNANIFRCVPEEPDTTTKLRLPKTTMRPPGNIPYVVDNLWEWKRPDEYPSRRHCVFASPRPELASDSGTGTVYSVEFKGRNQLCQVKGYRDSKFHPECKDLKKLILKLLGQDWLDGDLTQKGEIGRLWIPCLRKDDMDSLFESNQKLREIRSDIYDSINYWNDVVIIEEDTSLPDENGELFFWPEDGYYLRDI